MRMIKSKRGSLLDAVYIPAFIMVTAATLLIALYVWISFQTVFSSTVSDSVGQGLITSGQNTTIQNAMGNVRVSLNAFNYAFPILVIGLMLVSLIFAYKTGSSAIYAVISIILWAFAVFFSFIFTDIFTQIASSFPTESAQFTIVGFIMTNLRYFVLVWVFLLSVVMLSRNKKEEQFIAASEMAYGGAYG